MSSIRRRLMSQVASDQNALPDGCVRLEYIESTGTQWIDTEKVVYADEELILDYSFYRAVGNIVIMGWRYTGSFSNTSQCYINFNGSTTDNKLLLFYGTAALQSNGISMPIGVKSKLIISTLKRKIFVDGVEQNGTYDQTFTLAYDGEKGSVFNNYLFAINIMGTKGVLSPSRIYEYSLKDYKGNYTQHLIPILDPNGTPCFYDTVTKKFHYNKGTGTFLYKIAE